MLLLTSCGRCNGKMIVSLPLDKYVLSARPVLCQECFEVNVVVVSIHQLEKPKTFPVGRKFHFDRLLEQQNEILAQVMQQLFIVMQQAAQNQEVLDHLRINQTEAKIWINGLSRTLADLDTSKRFKMVKQFKEMLEDSMVSPAYSKEGENFIQSFFTNLAPSMN